MFRTLTCLVALTLASPALGQVPGQPMMPGRPQQRPAAADLPPGTATLRGRVFGADTGLALRKAQVRITQVDVQQSPGAFRENRLATTDTQGVFEFKELRAGRYSLTASKGSYVALQYGQTRPFEQGKPIEIMDGQTIERVDFSLPRGGIITGRILDEYGEPLSDVSMAMQRFQYMNGQRQLVSAGRFAQTNDLGEFRIYGVPPGQYFLQATYRNFSIMGGGDDQRIGYAPMFYPGTTESATAQRLTVSIGSSISGLVMTMRPAKAVRVSGTATDSMGRPMTGMLMVMQSSGGNFMNIASSLRPDGTFTLNGMAPGEYTLRAQQMGRSPADAESGSAHITVATDDISDLVLRGSPPAVARGQVIVDAAARPSLPQRLMLTIQPVPFMPILGAAPAAVLDDLSFEIKAPPGVMRLNLGPGVNGWAIRTVRLNGSDVTDTGFELKSTEEISGLEVELTNKLTTISGVVTNARGEALKDYTTIVFTQEKTRWGTNQRYQGIGRADQEGRFKINALPPGEYYAIALDHVDTGEMFDPEFLERIYVRASTMTLHEGETKQLDLRLQANP